MAWSKQHKEISKDRILCSAAKLFTQHGFENVSIDQVMSDAELTRGAFYSHFNSKSELYSQAIIKAGQLAGVEQAQGCDGNLDKISQRYLCGEHRDHELQHPCPLASLISDINQQDPMVREAYTILFKKFVTKTETHVQDSRAALQTAALMIGGLALAKAISDEALSDSLLVACQEAILQLNNKGK